MLQGSPSCGNSNFLSRIPPEIFRLIFEEALPGLDIEDTAPSSNEVPLNVSHTCRYWRDVSLQTASLWSRFTVIYLDSGGGGVASSNDADSDGDVDSNDDIDAGGDIDASGDVDSSSDIDSDDGSDGYSSQLSALKVALDTFLERSRGRLLDFRVWLRIGDDDFDLLPVAEPMILALLQNQKRWRNVFLDYKALRLDISVEAVEVPELEELELRFRGQDRVRDEEKKSIIAIDTTHCPRLRRLSLTGLFSIKMNELVKPNLTGVELVFEYTFDPTEFADICFLVMQTCPNLEEFVAVTEPSPREPIGQRKVHATPVVLPYLRVLHIDAPNMLTEVLENLTAPALKRLTLISDDSVLDSYEVQAEGPLLVEFLRRSSSPPIKYLDLIIETANGTYLVEVLRLLPRLEFIQFGYAFFEKEFWEALTVKPDSESSGVLCPSLKEISIQFGEDYWDDAEEAIVDLVISRWEYTESFSHVTLDIDAHDNILDFSGTNKYTTKGLDLIAKHRGIDRSALSRPSFRDMVARIENTVHRLAGGLV